MSSGKFCSALELPLRPTRMLARWILFLHALTAAVVIAACMASPATLGVLLILAGVSAAHAWRRYLADPVVRIVYDGPESIQVEARSGNVSKMQRSGPALVHPRLVILNLAGTGRSRRTVFLTPGTAPPAALRRLRVRLRWPAEAPA